MADEARLNDLLDLVQQARDEGDTETETQAVAAFRRESGYVPPINRSPRESVAPQTPIRTDVMHNMAAGADIVKGAAVNAIARPVLGSAAALVAKLTGQDTDQARELGTNAVPEYEYSTREGEQVARDVSTAVEPIGRGLQKARAAIDSVSPFAGEVVGELGETAMDAGAVASGVVGGKKIVGGLTASREAAAAKRAAELAERNARITGDIEKVGKPNVKDLADTLGLRLGAEDIELADPSQKVGVGKGFVESLASNSAMRTRQLGNRSQAEVLVREEFKFPEGVPADRPFTEKVIADQLKPFNSAYDEVAKAVQNVRFGDEEIATILKADDSASLLRAPAEVRGVIDDLVPKLQSGEISGQQLLTTIRDLRDRARQLSVNATSEQATAGAMRSKQALIKIAEALETRLLDEAARTGGRELAMDLLNSRQAQAQLHSLQRSTTADHLDFGKLREEKLLNPQMSGVMRAIADLSEAAPLAFAEYGKEISGKISFLMRAPRAIGTKGLSEMPHALAQMYAQRAGTPGNVVLGEKGQIGAYYRNPGEIWNAEESVRRLKQRLEAPPGQVGDLPSKGAMPANQADRSLLGPGHDVAPGQEGFNFTEPTAVEAAGAPFDGAPKINAQPNPAPRGLALASGRDPIPPSSAPTRGTVLRRSVEKAKADADKLSLEGRMEVPEAKRKLDFKNLRLEGGPPEHLLPQGLDDLLEGRMGSRDWDPNKPERKSPNPKLRKGGDLALPEGQVMGLPAPVNVEWTPNDVVQWALQLDPTDKAALIRYMRGEK